MMSPKTTQHKQPAGKRSRSWGEPDAPSCVAGSGGGSAKRAKSKAAPAGETREPGTAYRGVTQHARSGRHEAHLWLEGKQHYVGSFSTASCAAIAYDIAALRLRGASAQTNFHVVHYAAALPELLRRSPDSLIAALRRYSRGATTQQSSMYRGVCRHFKGRWEARIGSTGGKRYQYLGLHDSEVEAALAYDRAALAAKGLDAATNFHLSEYWELLSGEQQAQATQRGLLTAADLQLRREVQAAMGAQGPASQLPALGGAVKQEAEVAALPSPLTSPSSCTGGDSLLTAGTDLSPGSATAGGSETLASLLIDCILQDSAAASPQSVLECMTAGRHAPSFCKF